MMIKVVNVFAEDKPNKNNTKMVNKTELNRTNPAMGLVTHCQMLRWAIWGHEGSQDVCDAGI